MVEPRGAATPLGICGLVKRDALPGPDIGLAFLPEYWSVGYAYESAAGVKHHAFDVLRLPRLLAIVNPDNRRSIRIVERLGFAADGMIALSDGAPEVRLFSLEPPASRRQSDTHDRIT